MSATTVQTWPNHSNDIGDWCPFSDEPIKGDDTRCPQGCRASDPEADADWDEDDHSRAKEDARAEVLV
ncbi:MAG: hypothetical protein ABIQ18_21550 [Umezawaea sp.]